MIKFKNQSGQSLFELVMAIGVISMVVVVLVSLVNNAIQSAAFSRNQSLAAKYAESGTEWLRTQRDTDIVTFLTRVSTPTYCLKNEPPTWQSGVCPTGDVITGTIFTRQVDFLVSLVPFPAPPAVPTGNKTVIKATVTVSWTDSKGNHRNTNATQFTDWRQR